MTAPKICFDRILPNDLHRQMQARTINGKARAITPKGKQWVNGSTIKICMVDGSAADHALVEKFAPRWTEHANLTFAFTTDPRAEIRVKFDEQDGAWSYIGLDNKGIPLHAATLNLGWVDEAVILHEFGHMIGLAHEHSSPLGGIEWNVAEVIRDLSGPPNYWDQQTIQHNVLDKYTVDQVNGTDFDRDSIMLYEFPARWTKNNVATPHNTDLSRLDKWFVQSEAMYPRLAAPEERAVDLAIGQAKEAGVGAAGEEDLYQFQVASPGSYLVETEGSSDVVVSLFGPRELTRLIATDDDSGRGLNARIRAALAEGVYFVRVSHYDAQRTGEYRISVRAA